MQRQSGTIILSKIAHISDPLFFFFSFLNDTKSDVMKELGMWHQADLDGRSALAFTSTVTLGRSLNLSQHAPQHAGNDSDLFLGGRMRDSLSKCLKVSAHTVFSGELRSHLLKGTRTPACWILRPDVGKQYCGKHSQSSESGWPELSHRH